MLDLAKVEMALQPQVEGSEDGQRLIANIQAAKSALHHVLDQGFDHWISTFSGGKDSTTSVIMTLEAALERPDKVRRIDVAYADTLIEIPSIHESAMAFLDSLRKSCKLESLPLFIHVATPAIEDRFWVRLLGKGYPPPHQRFRWCTKRLKIKPVEDALKQYIQPNKSAIITGVRFGESKSRDQRLLQSCSRGGECGQGIWFQYSSRLQAGYLAPLIDWPECDVWDFLNFIGPDWGYNTQGLERIYSGHDTRFGCWMCTVVKQDKAMAKTVSLPEWSHLAPLGKFRNHVWEATRDIRSRELHKDGSPGRLTLAMRQNLLKQLLEAQSTVGLELVAQSDIHLIQTMWKEEDNGFQ